MKWDHSCRLSKPRFLMWCPTKAGLLCSPGTRWQARSRPPSARFATVGILLALFFSRLSPAAEVNMEGEDPVRAAKNGPFGVGRSRDVVLRLSALFALDSFGGGFVAQSFAAY